MVNDAGRQDILVLGTRSFTANENDPYHFLTVHKLVHFFVCNLVMLLLTVLIRWNFVRPLLL